VLWARSIVRCRSRHHLFAGTNRQLSNEADSCRFCIAFDPIFSIRDALSKVAMHILETPSPWLFLIAIDPAKMSESEFGLTIASPIWLVAFTI
jgi:hypothetical protein